MEKTLDMTRIPEHIAIIMEKKTEKKKEIS